MRFSDWQREKGAYIQRTGLQPDHCLIHPADAQELIDTAGVHGRIVEQTINRKKVKTHAMIDGVPVLQRDDQSPGVPVFENRVRMPYEAPPAFMKPKQPRPRE